MHPGVFVRLAFPGFPPSRPLGDLTGVLVIGPKCASTLESPHLSRPAGRAQVEVPRVPIAVPPIHPAFRPSEGALNRSMVTQPSRSWIVVCPRRMVCSWASLTNCTRSTRTRESAGSPTAESGPPPGMSAIPPGAGPLSSTCSEQSLTCDGSHPSAGCPCLR